MDPNQWFFNFMQNSQPQSGENTQNTPSLSNFQPNQSSGNLQFPFFPYPYQFPIRPMGSSGVDLTGSEPETPIGSVSESQVPPFSTQIGLENISLDGVGGSTDTKKSRLKFSTAEDTLLIQTWLNVSKDSIVGVDQKSESFWKRIKENYNEHCGGLPTRKIAQLKARWHRLNATIQYFAGCYKQAFQRQRSGSCENDILQDALAIYKQDKKADFTNYIVAWRLLKDEPKWTGDAFECSSKRTKNSDSGAYSSSSNPATLTSGEYNPDSPSLVQPMGQKAAKRKAKGKAVETSEMPDKIAEVTAVVREATSERVAAMKELARVKDDENRRKDLKILYKDTSEMPEKMREDHEKICNMIRARYGLN